MRQALQAWLQQVAQGNGGFLFLSGERGSGRTALVREMTALAPQMGLLPAEGWCRGEQVEPVWVPVAHLLEQVAQAFPDDPAARPLNEQVEQWLRTPHSRFLPVQMARTLRTIARKQPLLLCLDDFHRASEPLVRMLESWLFGVRYEPIGILLTLATPLENPALYALIRRTQEQSVGQEIAIPPLTEEETAALVRQWCPALSESKGFIHTLWQRTGGNLLFTVEILRAVAGNKTLRVDSADWEGWIPAGLRMLVQRSAQELSARDRALLQWLSCFEGGIPCRETESEPGLLTELTGVKARQVARSVENLMPTGWLEAREGVLGWRHPLVREVLYESIPGRQRAQMHRQIAELLESPAYADLPDEQKWFHWMRAEPDARVLERLWAAHHRARYRSPARFRLQLLDACLLAATQQGAMDRRLALLAERPHLLFVLPDGLLRALEASQEALAAIAAHPEYDPQRNLWVQVHCARAGQLAQLGRALEAESELQNLLRAGGWSSTQQSMLELSLAYVLACQGKLQAALAFHRAVWTCMRPEREWQLRWIGTLRYTLRLALACGDAGLANAVLEQMEQLAEPAQNLPAWEELWHLMQGEKAFYEGRGAEMLYHVRALRALEASVEAGSAVYELAFFSLLYRDAAEALHVAEQALRLTRQAVGFEREGEWLYNRALALIEGERFQEAEESLAESRRLAQKMGNGFLLARCLLMQAQAALLRHQPENALSLLEQARPLVAGNAIPELQVEYARLRSLYEAAQHDWQSALESAEQAVHLAERWGHALFRGLNLLQRAQVKREMGAGDSVLQDEEQAESLLTEYGKPLWLRRLRKPAPDTPVFSTAGWELEVRLLGPMSVRFRQRQMTPAQWVSPRTRALFAHLVLARGRPVHADTLCESHFPHLPLERARVNLQTTISAVRRSLRAAFGNSVGDWVHHESGLYRWAPPHGWIADVFEFERIAQEALALNELDAREARLHDALRLYQGDLCSEFSEEDWCQPDAQRLRALYLECLLMLGQIASVKEQHHEVIDYCERALQLDPCDEASVRLLMRAYHALGRRADVQYVYTRCQKALAEILQTPPAEPTRQLYESLLRS